MHTPNERPLSDDFPFLTELLSSNMKNKYSAAQKTYKLFAGKLDFYYRSINNTCIQIIFRIVLTLIAILVL